MPETSVKPRQHGTSHACHLCAQIAGRAENDLLQQTLATPNYLRRVAFESADFALIPSLGALVEGHVLAVPKRHACSFAQLATGAAETASFLRQARALVGEAFGEEVQLFEHGTGAASSEPACSVEHAHVHLVPCRVDLQARLEDRYHWTGVGDEDELRQLIGDGEYIRVRTGDDWMVAAEPDGFPSQLLRRELREALSPSEPDGWNWRTDPRPEVVNRTFDRLCGVASA